MEDPEEAANDVLTGPPTFPQTPRAAQAAREGDPVGATAAANHRDGRLQISGQGQGGRRSLGDSEEDDDDDEDDEDDDDDDDYNYYYSFQDEDLDVGGGAGDGGSGQGGGSNNNDDPEFISHQCLSWADTDRFLQESVDAVLATGVQASSSEVKMHLHRNLWRPAETATSMQQQRIATVHKRSTDASVAEFLSGSANYLFCHVCATNQSRDHFSALPCGHGFCATCWECYFENQVKQGCSTGVSCMSSNCDELAPESFVTGHLRTPAVRQRYVVLVFREYVRSHPQLRFCPGHNGRPVVGASSPSTPAGGHPPSAASASGSAAAGSAVGPGATSAGVPVDPSSVPSPPTDGCEIVIKVDKSCAKRCICSNCKASFCFKCGADYHAPTDCDTIRLWLTKCADDSETANYISAHTKDCPKCNICIEKNGGCNHMQCYNCKHDFCWMCLGDWKSHGSEYYECSRYKENPNIAHESVHAQAREALKKYLHYFERWENHSKSMKLEAQTLEKIKNRITEKVMEGSGTWIDWQYLLDASALLAKCRYTLQYTYPYAYYMEPCPRKELFEYQQAQLEAEIENLSWKIEHAESTDRGDLENQIDIAEKRRTSLLKDFLPTS